MHCIANYLSTCVSSSVHPSPAGKELLTPTASRRLVTQSRLLYTLANVKGPVLTVLLTGKEKGTERRSRGCREVDGESMPSREQVLDSMGSTRTAEGSRKCESESRTQELLASAVGAVLLGDQREEVGGRGVDDVDRSGRGRLGCVPSTGIDLKERETNQIPPKGAQAQSSPESEATLRLTCTPRYPSPPHITVETPCLSC